MLVAQSCLTLCNLMDCSPPGTWSMRFSREGYWSGLPFPFPGIFPTQGLKLGLLHCRQILYWLSYKGSPYLQTSKCLYCWKNSLLTYRISDQIFDTKRHWLPGCQVQGWHYQSLRSWFILIKFVDSWNNPSVNVLIYWEKCNCLNFFKGEMKGLRSLLINK